MPATPAWLAAVEVVLNRNIGTQSRAALLARRLQGKSLQVELHGLSPLRATCRGGRLTFAAPENGEADAVIAGPPGALLRLLTADADRPLGSGGLQIRGDAQVAAGYRELLQLARPDPEEEAARLIGDLPARRLGNIGRLTISWLRRTRRTFGENIAEYLQEESRDLPAKSEVEEFLRGVDGVRESADRVEARVKRLERRGRQGRKPDAP
ncbi:MAG TPA: SCP2 sterol-binding domain-containing protein [Steroidobacteraceae bacterium]|nr:SCP2 sterol-binding domain-containing protein [Steroidobacteraceae bacterium]